MSPRFSTISGCFSNGSSALASSFLEQTARMTPRRRQFARVVLERDDRPRRARCPGRARCPPARRRRSRRPTACCRGRAPGICTTAPAARRAGAPTRSPYIGAAAGDTSCLARCHSAGSCQRADAVARRARIERQQIDALGLRHRAAVAAFSRGDEGGARAGQTVLVVAEQRRDAPAAAVCWMIGQRNASRDMRQQSRMREAVSCNAAAASSADMAADDAGGEMIRVQREQHRVRLERVQRRAGIGQFLPILAVIVLVDRGVQCRGAAPRRGWRRADARRCRSRGSPAAPACRSPPPAPHRRCARRRVSSSALVLMKSSRVLASATAASQSAAASAGRPRSRLRQSGNSGSQYNAVTPLTPLRQRPP